MREKLRRIMCALFRHSNIEDVCFGYHYCARCGDEVGDSLAGIYGNSEVVGIGCDCELCRYRYSHMGLVDTFLTKKPEWIGETEGWTLRERAKAEAALKAMETERNESTESAST